MTLLIIIIALALIFDYINGFHDAANSIATIVSTDAVEGVTVYNTLGQKICSGNSTTVDLSGLEQGLYLVEVTFEGNRTTTQKIVKN